VAVGFDGEGFARPNALNELGKLMGRFFSREVGLARFPASRFRA